MERVHVAVVGSGFAGTILARILHTVGVRVVLLERHRHPRFAIGESSTPLGAIGLERLAKRYGLDDLHWLAAYGRWMREMPTVRRGLKRGFTFFRHETGAPFTETPDNANRLLVAASPSDDVSDTHWLREDVDAFLVDRAVAEGVDYRDEVTVERAEQAADRRWTLTCRRHGAPLTIAADVVIDGSGAGGLLAAALGIPSRVDDQGLDTGLVFAHLADVPPFADLAPGPYPDEKAAVHHLLHEGWMYVLPFDHGVVSAGILLRRDAWAALAADGTTDPEAMWDTMLRRYPSLERQFGSARAVRPFQAEARVQRWLARAAGPGWALLPHAYAFLDPMFSMGIALSLRGVERLALILEGALRDDTLDVAAVAAGFEQYDRQLNAEVAQMARLLEGAYHALDDFALFTAQSFLYFATVSYREAEERLFPDGRGAVPNAWTGFLRAGDEVAERVFEESRTRLAAMRGRTVTNAERDAFAAWVTEAITDRNVAGLADPERRNLYPVDLDVIVARAGLLGMTEDEMRGKLHLLRGSV